MIKLGKNQFDYKDWKGHHATVIGLEFLYLAWNNFSTQNYSQGNLPKKYRHREKNQKGIGASKYRIHYFLHLYALYQPS